MKKINLNGIKPEKKLFHNERIDVYPRLLKFEEITFWHENYRTVLHFDLLKKKFGKKTLPQIPFWDIVAFVAEQKNLQIPKLADSIKRNGVKVPLIVLEDGTLLDGNRRFFACAYLQLKATEKKEERPKVLDEIPAGVIKNSDVTKKLRLKILAEANFVSDYKVPWSLDVKAKVINDYYQACKERGLSQEKAYEEIDDVFSVQSQQVREYIETLGLTKQFVATGKTNPQKDHLREIVQDNFVYFWEFRNKAMSGEGALPKASSRKVRDLFFVMMQNDRFKNMKQVEPMIRAINDNFQWKMLEGSGGSKIDQVEAVYKEEKAIKSYEDKIRYFLNWLKRNKDDSGHFSEGAYKLLSELEKLCGKVVNVKKS